MKVLLVEDDFRIAELLKKGFEEQNFEVTVAYDGLEAQKYVQNQDFDIIVTDILLPEINGLDFCKKLKKFKPHIPVLMLTALGETDDKLEGFDAGADDYMVKPFDFRELLARMKALTKRFEIPSQSKNILQYANLIMDLTSKTVKRNHNEIQLTPKEFKLLEFMMKNPEKVLSKEEIAQKVWNINFDTGTNFIDVYINYLRKKIDKDFSPKLIHTKPGMGYVLKAES